MTGTMNQRRGGEDLSPEEEDKEPGDVGDEEFEGEV